MKGQTAFEYAIIVCVAIVILLPLWININNTMGITKIELQSSYSAHAVSKLQTAADAVYLQGVPAKFTVIINLPEGVDSVSISNHEISMRMSSAAGQADMIAMTLAEVEGSISPRAGAHRVTVEALATGTVNMTESA
ncbi:Uncharacterised protein [Candidatus Burarchaeum australiense]|nr:Uncharacterised protein [Candidatus Burarchaeum australiense]